MQKATIYLFELVRKLEIRETGFPTQLRADGFDGHFGPKQSLAELVSVD